MEAFLTKKKLNFQNFEIGIFQFFLFVQCFNAFMKCLLLLYDLLGTKMALNGVNTALTALNCVNCPLNCAKLLYRVEVYSVPVPIFRTPKK